MSLLRYMIFVDTIAYVLIVNEYLTKCFDAY